MSTSSQYLCEQRIQFRSGLPQLASQTQQYLLPLRFVNSTVTINSGKLLLSRCLSQPKYFINTKYGDRINFPQPPIYFSESQYYRNLAYSNATYLPRNHNYVSPIRQQKNYSPSPRKTYLLYEQQGSPIVHSQQNFIYQPEYIKHHQSKSPPKDNQQSISNEQNLFDYQQPVLQKQNQFPSFFKSYQQEQPQYSDKPQFNYHNQPTNPQRISSQIHSNKPNSDIQIKNQQEIRPQSQQPSEVNIKQQSQNDSNKPQSQQPQKQESNKPQQQQQPSDIQDKPQSEQPQEQKQIAQPLNLQPLPIPQLIDQLYNVSWRKRHVEEQYKYFLRGRQNLTELYKNYSIRQLSMKKQLSEIVNGFIIVRGDGNCFYTAFGYQFLLLLLTKYTDEQYNEFINYYKPIIEFKINTDDGFKIESKQDQDQVSDFFYGTLDQLKQYPNNGEREQELYRRSSVYYEVDEHANGLFYGASTIFFRNLANYLVQFSETLELLYDRQNLLIWEQECNNNEIVIEILAKKLNLYIQLILFGQDFKLNQYGNAQNNKIILLMKPGHYNVGLFDENAIKQQE